MNPIQSKVIPFTPAELFLGQNGLPTRKTVGYKFTPLSRLMPESLSKNEQTTISEPLSLWNESRVLFGGGVYNEKDSSLPAGVEIKEISKDQYTEEIKNAMQALNLLASNKFYQLNIPANTSIERLKVESSAAFSDDSNCDGVFLHIVVGENSKVNLFDYGVAKSTAHSLVNSFTTIDIQKNATVNHFVLTEGTDEISYINNRKINLNESANYKGIYFDDCMNYTRNDLEVVLKEEMADAKLFGLYTLIGKQFSDNFINVHHRAPHSTSSQLFKGILKDRSRAVFTGKVLVDAGANQVDSSQLNKNILLDNTAQVHTEPQLEVYTDDVKCGHGATVGQLSEDEIFYLESRGIPKERAFRILCQAYTEEILQNIDCAELRKFFHDKLYAHFDFSSMAMDLIKESEK